MDRISENAPATTRSTAIDLTETAVALRPPAWHDSAMCKGKPTSSSRLQVSAMVGATVAKHSLAPTALAAALPKSAAKPVEPVENTDSGAARTTKNVPSLATGRDRRTDEPLLRPPARLAVNRNSQAQAKSRNINAGDPASMTPLVEDASPSELITLAQAAELLNVHYMTAYRYVRTGRMLAEKRAGQWWVTAADLAAVVAEGTGARRRPAADRPARELLVEPFTARLIAGDVAGCWDLISSALSGGATPSDVHQQLLHAALVEVGERWRRGEISVAAEHRATSAAYRLLGQMGPLFRHRGRRRGTIVLGITAGDPHALPSAMMADLLSDPRFDVIDLGANTPTESFVEVCSGIDDVVGVGLCVVLDEFVASAIDQAADLRAALPDAFLVLGGASFAHPATDLLDIADAVSASAEEACRAFEEAATKRA